MNTAILLIVLFVLCIALDTAVLVLRDVNTHEEKRKVKKK